MPTNLSVWLLITNLGTTVVINNHTLPHAEKCKYFGHIINNNLTDDDDIARQKRCVPLKQLYLIHTVVQCIPQVFGVIFKNRVCKVLLLPITTVLQFYTTCQPAVVQVICSLLIMLNPLKNAFAHQYLAFYAV